MRSALLIAAPEEEAWWDEAACRHVDPDYFFPARGESTKEAKAICATCPVRDECLEFALRNRIAHGVWGGRSEHERRPMRRERERVAS